MQKMVFIFSVVFFFIALSCKTSFAGEKPPQNVIYITIDGTRYQDFFARKKTFPLLWKRYAHLGEFAGGITDKSMVTASTPISLPSYMSMTTGQVQQCFNNECPRVKASTFIDKLSEKLNLKPDRLAVFSSWNLIKRAACNDMKHAYINTGNIGAISPVSHKPDEVMNTLNRQQESHPSHWDNADRYDKYTYRQAKHYLTAYKPRFLWISLGDTDEYAHANDMRGYIKALKQSDSYVDDLFQTLKTMTHYTQNTTIIITTDHGRGDGKNWTNHGPKFIESKNSFLFVINGRSLLNNSRHPVRYLKGEHFSTLSIRPLIESIMLG
jgi:predicted AlkP superfamily pyrophosphatase or phosphodiesterase